ncbi:putative Retinol dehydrogenase 13 [Paratrimastix pyriformis]|uniref:Retinol dehydrogenase 13 n=1 Tax=Paratrimastix pyriformis TaxID=342808 RepID=A0ABQ8UJK9_9EUKA|nr:putative Retinol dehydrogenase 13 [Paratrimastix pyriformis]
MFSFWPVLIVVLLLVFRINIRRKTCYSQPALMSKAVVMTGGSHGIGYQTALSIVEQCSGVTLIIGCRDGEEAQKVFVDCPKAKDSTIILEPLELSSPQSIRLFALRCLDHLAGKELGALILNAGTFEPKRVITTWGFEKTMAVNYLGSYLLVHELWDCLLLHPTRVMVIDDGLHTWSRLPASLSRPDVMESLLTQSPPRPGMASSPLAAYAQSKLCGVLFSTELNRRLVMAGGRARCNCIRPTPAMTNLTRRFPLWLRLLYRHLGPVLFTTSPAQSAQSTLYCCHSNRMHNTGGAYIFNCKLAAPPSRQARRDDLARVLWEATDTAMRRHLKQAGLEGLGESRTCTQLLDALRHRPRQMPGWARGVFQVKPASKDGGAGPPGPDRVRQLCLAKYSGDDDRLARAAERSELQRGAGADPGDSDETGDEDEESGDDGGQAAHGTVEEEVPGEAADRPSLFRGGPGLVMRGGVRAGLGADGRNFGRAAHDEAEVRALLLQAERTMNAFGGRLEALRREALEAHFDPSTTTE